jgi:hypothetical protein
MFLKAQHMQDNSKIKNCKQKTMLMQLKRVKLQNLKD